MANSIDDEAVYRVVEEEGALKGAWPALISDRLGVDKTKVRPALLRLQDAGRVHEIHNTWYPGLMPTDFTSRVNHPKTASLMLVEAWGFIADRHPEEEWPEMMREGVNDLREMNSWMSKP